MTPLGLNQLSMMAEAPLFVSSRRNPDPLTTHVNSVVGATWAPLGL